MFFLMVILNFYYDCIKYGKIQIEKRFIFHDDNLIKILLFCNQESWNAESCDDNFGNATASVRQWIW